MKIFEIFEFFELLEFLGFVFGISFSFAIILMDGSGHIKFGERRNRHPFKPVLMDWDTAAGIDQLTQLDER